ncbi:MAG TPA: phytanoyl-CoA dioxygenase family protein [Caulobacteraceae bacterium]|nr:phytanoyl-CoA dioxygenase family protein [Caulobacteraceae bacterium]
MAELARLSSNDGVDDVVAALERDGGVVIEGFLSPDTFAGLRADLIPLLERQAQGRDRFSGFQTRRLGALFAHTRHCAPIATHPLYLSPARHFLCRPREVWVGDRRRPVAADVRIGVTQAIQLGPGQPAQPLHRDDTAFLWRHPTQGREGRVQVICAVTDFTAENGGTLVIPGSHLWDDERQPQMSEAIATVMQAGSALIFLGSTFHAGGANSTASQWRAAAGLALDASNVRQEENMYLALAPEVVASYPEEIQRLLGWSAGTNHMGWVEVDGQMVDPIHLLRAPGGAPLQGVGAANH